MSAPKLPYSDAVKYLVKAGVGDDVALLGIRGYYKRTMGNPTKNDRGIYDDAIFLVSKDIFVSFNANTDPSIYRKGVAVLKPGLWKYRLGIHGLSRPVGQRYKALVQAAEVTVQRDELYDDTGWFGINIHRGGERGTSSLGCQTIVPSQWDAFIMLVEREMKRAEQKVVPYLLVEN